MNWLSKIFGFGSKTTRSARRGTSQTRLGVELLEGRQLMAGGLMATIAAASPPPPDMTAVARMFPAHSGPTTLYLNFDGWTHYDKPLFQAEGEIYGYNAQAAGIVYDVANFFSDAWAGISGHDSMPDHNISPFQTTTGNRDADIHDIMYRVSQEFAPYNVQVQRIFGDGAFSHSNGNTTIFVGKDSSPTGADNMTPLQFVDISGKTDYGVFGIIDPAKAAHRAPNSDKFDIAFCNRRADQDNVTISQAIAHEAGHTFGLAHIRVDGLTDATGSIPNVANGAPDVMSYDSANQAFVNQTFNITDYNNAGGPQPVIDKSLHPRWNGALITLQNSHTYLQAVLGNRAADDTANVADPSTLGVALAAPQIVSTNASVNHRIETRGDYDVYQLANASSVTGTLYLSVQGLTLGFDPVLTVYVGCPASGNTQAFYEIYKMVSFNNDRAGNDRSSVIAFPAGALHYASSVKFVVGAANNGSTGSYRFRVTDHAPDLAVKPIDFQILSRTTPGSGRVRISGTIVNQGNAVFASTSASPAVVQLIESVNGADRVVAQRTLTSLAAGQQVTLTYDRDWSPPAPPHGLGTGNSAPLGNLDPSGQSSVGSMAQSSTPTGTPTTVDIMIPLYRLVIKVPGFNAAGSVLDGDPTNNETFRSGSDFTAMFGVASAQQAMAMAAAATPAKPVTVPTSTKPTTGSTGPVTSTTEIKASEGTTAGAIRG